jgi:hypothetical protein
MAFTVEKKLELAYLGNGWNGCFLRFNGMTFAETREFAKLNIAEGDPANEESLLAIMNLLKSHLVEGKGWNGSEVVPITADDLQDLPTDVITKSIELLAGTTDPKSSTN